MIVKLYEKLCIAVQLSHYPSKIGPGDIYQVICLEPLDIAIESSLGEEGKVWKILLRARKLPFQYQKERMRDRTDLEVTFPCWAYSQIVIAINRCLLPYM